MITKLPSGNSLITKPGYKEKILKIITERGLKIMVLKNEYPFGSDAWANREIEIHETIKQYS